MGSSESKRRLGRTQSSWHGMLSLLACARAASRKQTTVRWNRTLALLALLAVAGWGAPSCSYVAGQIDETGSFDVTPESAKRDAAAIMNFVTEQGAAKPEGSCVSVEGATVCRSLKSVIFNRNYFYWLPVQPARLTRNADVDELLYFENADGDYVLFTLMRSHKDGNIERSLYYEHEGEFREADRILIDRKLGRIMPWPNFEWPMDWTWMRIISSNLRLMQFNEEERWDLVLNIVCPGGSAEYQRRSASPAAMGDPDQEDGWLVRKYPSTREVLACITQDGGAGT